MDLQLLDKVPSKHMLILGDVMLDRYTTGNADRQSPEAPVPILSVEKTFARLGGAANVALNIKALGAQATIIGVVGADDAGDLLYQTCKRHGVNAHLVQDKSRRTTVKHRYLSKGKHLLRVDDEDLHDISQEVANELMSHLESILDDVSGVIISDYNKGCLTKDVIDVVLQMCKMSSVPVYVDPKFNNFQLYKGVRIFKPNLKELHAGLGDFASPVEELIRETHEVLGCDSVICTMASKGIAYVKGGAVGVVPAETLEIVDVSGAGDTVMAVSALADQCGMKIQEICKLSNIAGKIVCLQSGVVSVCLEDLKKEACRPSADKKIL